MLDEELPFEERQTATAIDTYTANDGAAAEAATPPPNLAFDDDAGVDTMVISDGKDWNEEQQQKFQKNSQALAADSDP